MQPKLQNVSLLPLAPSAMERLRKHGLLPKVVLYLKEPAGISLVVTEGNLNLEVIGDKVYMDEATFKYLFKMSGSKAKTARGKRVAVQNLINKALKSMIEDLEAAKELENEDT